MMDVKSRGVPLLLFLQISAIFLSSFSTANQLLHPKNPRYDISFHSLLSSTVLPLRGNVYPLGYFRATLNVGNPLKAFELNIETDSDLTWFQCDVQCKGCTVPKEKLYKPNNNSVTMKCSDPLCAAISSPPQHGCTSPSTECAYEITYADLGVSKGVLVRDLFPIKTTNGSSIRSELAFGCGFDLQHPALPKPTNAGILGLGIGKMSIMSQLASQGLTRNVVGHCFSSQGGGFLFFGDQLIPSSGVVWVPIQQQSSPKPRYNAGPADLFFNKMPTSGKGLKLHFYLGSPYTYFNSQAYTSLVNLISDDLKGKPLSRATPDPSLPVCWKGAKPFKSVSDVNSYFKPLSLVFTSSKNSELLLPPASYLVITQQGNVCLGILDSSAAKLGNVNVIGDISLLDKVVIYDNEKQQVGWASADCNRPLL